MTISDRLRELAKRHPSRTAVVFERGPRVTFADLDALTNRIASALLQCGISPGDRIIALMKNRPEYVALYFAAARVGGVIVPANRRASASEVEGIARGAQAALLVTEVAHEPQSSHLLRVMPDLAVVSIGGQDRRRAQGWDCWLERAQDSGAESTIAIEGSDLQSIHFTSGTTGTPRGVLRSHAANVAVAHGALLSIPADPTRIWMHTLPMNSVGVYAFLLAPILAGGTVAITADVRPELILDLVDEHRIEMLHAVPTVWEMLMGANLERPHNSLASIRCAYWGGSPLLPGTASRLESWMRTPVLGCYGATEAPCVSYSTDAIYGSGRFDSSGPAIRGMEARVVDAVGAVAPCGVAGEVQLRGDALMSGYLDEPDLTIAAWTEDGWYITGDWGRIDSDGALTVIDRKKEMLITGGENVYPVEVERVISEIPGVVAVGVVGVPDELWGQSVWAFVEPTIDGVEFTAIEEACRSRLAGYKVPRRVVLVAAMPVNGTGKIAKPELVAMAGAIVGGAVPRAPILSVSSPLGSAVKRPARLND